MPKGGALNNLLPLLLTGISAIGALLIRASEHPKANYKSEVKKIQKDRWNDVCNALSPVITSLYEHVEDSNVEHSLEDLTSSDKAALLLRQALDDREDLEDVEDQLDRLDQPKRVYRMCRKGRIRSIWLFTFASVDGLVVTAFTFLLQRTFLSTVLVSALATIGAIFFIAALWFAKRYYDAQSKLDEMSEDIDFM